MTHIALHDVPHLCNRQLLPQLGDIGLQREVERINKVDGLVKQVENPFIRPNHHEFDDEHGMMQANKKIWELDCCRGRCDTHCPQKKNTPPTREPYFSSEGITQKCNGKVSKILDGLPISLGAGYFLSLDRAGYHHISIHLDSWPKQLSSAHMANSSGCASVMALLMHQAPSRILSSSYSLNTFMISIFSM